MVDVKELKKSFGKLQVLNGISFHLDPGKILVLIGPSGTGKSTLLRCLNYLERPSNGIITIGNVTVNARAAKKKEIYHLRSNTSMVFQNYHLFKNKTALENILEPLLSVKKLSPSFANAEALRILDEIGLSEKKDSYPSQLSGGQQQRIGIGRAIAVNPKVMLIDEPTSSLDPELVGEVLHLLYKLAAKHTTMIIATHEMEFARQIADHVLFMEHGQIVEEGDPMTLFTAPKKERTRQFLQKFSLNL
ncbi:amino acid ABC transporter ATP-binding protein [Suipraeoptans intestinalis]|uniref:Amino acid ABC transporter ATP-binding protein n=1 Tax=Suipraeoptans intestinalis TaxID=2606628 RepID=A0A6N7URP1_9FIRM|nr:amino acid ABC transporter ATP-binding protein [Suipraeoptans intestinalis]MDD7770391.1 amino acid ABC transporter ATP-binding protein [Suipraeoptans intestinalis]MDY3121360.1 amino acid ABC transporter ATP-binding protein [Suipraeoptans intestinalis]MSR93411.1 amino acid ABC transporter ATP-binding protein [Suipraeoptans intestinalis]